MAVANAIGLDPTNGEVTGTIDQRHVLDTLAELAEIDADNDDLFRDAAARVRRSRSAGAEEFHAGSRLGGSGEVTMTQLRYRAEMADVFIDLAIDVGLRHQHKLATVA